MENLVEKIDEIESTVKCLSTRIERLSKETEEVKEDVQYVTTALEEKIATQQSLLDVAEVLDDLEYDLNNLGSSIAHYQTLHERVVDLEFDHEHMHKQLEEIKTQVQEQGRILIRANIIYTTIFGLLNTGVWFLCYFSFL